MHYKICGISFVTFPHKAYIQYNSYHLDSGLQTFLCVSLNVIVNTNKFNILFRDCLFCASNTFMCCTYTSTQSKENICLL